MAASKIPSGVLPELDLESQPPLLGAELSALLKPLASLKITVTLFAMAIFVVVAGTLAQVHHDIWEVVRDYFRTPVAWIEVRVFFPKSFFVGTVIDRIGLTEIHENVQFPFPGGWLIGGVMVVNLLAAHALRFKVQAKAARLSIGLAVIAVGCGVTTAVIVMGSMQGGQQSQLLQEWPSLRILFQLLQGGLAGGILLAGCVMVFRRRAGIVLLHAGVLLMMFSELMVGLTAVEGQMSIREGETIDYEHDVRAVEIAFIDHSHPDHDRVTVVPLTETGVSTRFLDDPAPIKHADLPFEIKIDKYYRNSQPLEDLSVPNTKFRGAGRFVDIDEARAGTGTDVGGGVDLASVWVTLSGNNGAHLGKWLLSQRLKPQEIIVEGRKCEIDLRFKRTYVPYSVHLVDVRSDKYVGTETPSNFSSDIRLIGLKPPYADVDRTVHIWMNNPLRFAGKTFYQNTVNSTQSGIEVTGLQVVTNSGWMIPYVACMIIVIGMGYQFSEVLFRFQGRRARGLVGPEKKPEQEPEARPEMISAEIAARGPDGGFLAEGDSLEDYQAADKPWYQRAEYLVPLGVVLLMGGWIAGRTRPPSVATATPDLHAFGRVPVTYQGRVKPFDTLARNCLRVLSGRNTYIDNEGNRQPAIRWLLDEITNSDDAGGHEIFRIESLDVLATLKLTRRKGFRYAFKEFEDEVTPPKPGEPESEYLRAIKQAIKTPAIQMDLKQKKLRKLYNKLQLYFALRAAHSQLPGGNDATFERIAGILRTEMLTREGAELPLAVPSAERQWQPMAFESVRAWAREAASQWDCHSPIDLAGELVRRYGESRDPQFEQIVRERRIDSLIVQAMQEGSRIDEDQLRELIELNIDRLPEAEREQLLDRERQPMLAKYRQQVASMLVTLLGNEGLSEDTPVAHDRLVNIFQAWKADDAGTFNAEVQALAANYGEAEHLPQDYHAGRNGFEHRFNSFEPFYLSMILYILAFLLVAGSWFGWSTTLNRAAGWLVLLTFLLHTYGLLARIYISGRPPVTNLYSSAVFIGWGAVVAGMIIERIYRMGIGLLIATVSGFATLIIAQNLAGDGDTFTLLQAVLDTQFWLATHVVCITQGYTSTYVAGLLGALYILRGVLTPSLSERLGRDLLRAIYGMICAAMFFSFFGTVLGGLWADDSWGRFWGWDPKENGALIIVLWNALVLHARWGGLVKDRGLACLAVAGNITVSWSWWGVNELGVGLHSYGFTEGVLLALGLFCASQLVIIAMGCLPRELWRSYRGQAVAAVKPRPRRTG